MNNPLPKREMDALKYALNDPPNYSKALHWAYMRYIEGINANGDPRVTILSFSEWLNDGKPGPVTVR